VRPAVYLSRVRLYQNTRLSADQSANKFHLLRNMVAMRGCSAAVRCYKFQYAKMLSDLGPALRFRTLPPDHKGAVRPPPQISPPRCAPASAKSRHPGSWRAAPP
jgi:hypothetical protein